MDINSTLEHLKTAGRVNSLAVDVGRLFYINDPINTSFQTVEQVPHFLRNSWPYFLVFILVENVILWMERRPITRLNDGITSISHGIIQECGRLVTRGAESALYIYVYENFRIAELPWDSPITWYVALAGVDFCYYWVHRASHEVHILWAQHQVHHSSEDYNLAVGLRQSLLQGWCGFVFYIPMAFFVPPSHFVTHQQFNLIYQFWIHTNTVDTLGPLEYIFNTPQHHRVHHGSNLYALDKNYGGVFIIWDRMFGTFASENKKTDLIYGLVFNQPSFNPFFLQVFYNEHVLNKCRSMQGWKNKIYSVIKGPSWLPGSKWTGNDEDKIDVQPRVKYDVILPTWCNLYLLLHFLMILYTFQQVTHNHLVMSPLSVLLCVCYIILSLTTIGMLFDNRPNASLFELARCLLFVAYGQHYSPETVNSFVQTFFILSTLFWFLYCWNIVRVKKKVV